MITEVDGKQMKYVCPNCGGDNIGKSGLGDALLHCFTPCFLDIALKDIRTAEIRSPEELAVLRQEPY